MKRRRITMMTSLFLLGMIAGGAVVWLLKGHLPGTSAIHQASQAIVVEQAQGKEAKAELAALKQSFTARVDGAKETAVRLVQEMLSSDEEVDGAGPEWIQFQNAVGQCDEAALEEILLTLKRAAEHSPNQGPLLERLGSDLLYRMVALNPRKAIERIMVLEIFSESGRYYGGRALLELIAEQNPEVFKEAMHGGQFDSVHHIAEVVWLRVRAKEDPEGVFQDLMNRTPAARAELDFKHSDIGSVLHILARKDPEKALQLAPLFSSGGKDQFGDYKTAFLVDWAKRDPKAAGQWAMEQKDAPALLVCLSTDATAVDEEQLRDNFDSLGSSDMRTELASMLADRLAKKSIPESIHWAASLPDDEQDSANLAIAKQWIEKDPAAASQWLATWSAGWRKDGAVELLADAIVDDDPESALTWAASIQAKERFSLMRKALERLTGRDPAAAERALQTLSEEDREVLSVMKRAGLGG